jgi:hypothetical protein
MVLRAVANGLDWLDRNLGNADARLTVDDLRSLFSLMGLIEGPEPAPNAPGASHTTLAEVAAE